VEDINDDGYPDIIFTTTDSLVMCYDGSSGKQIFKINLQGKVDHITPAVGDINLDGRKDVVVCSEEGVIYLIYSAGYFSLLEKVVLYSDSPVYASPVIISSSKLVPTVVVCSYNGKITLIDGKTREVTTLNLVSITKKPHFITVAPGVGDINKDGIPELVVATSLPQYVTVVDISLSKVLWSYFVQPQPQEEIKFFSSPMVFDINNDNDNEVIFCSPGGYVYAFKGLTDFFGGELLWSLQVNQQRQVNRIVSQPAILNIVKDKKLEIVLGDEDGYIYIVGDEDGKGKILSSQKVEELPITSSIIVADLTGDGTVAVVYTTINNIIRVLTSSVKSVKNSIFSGMYLYTPTHSYKNIEDVTPQKNKVLFGSALIICVFLFNFVKNFSKKTKTPKRKVL
jgi:outer membrane protein assembly factor BamB